MCSKNTANEDLKLNKHKAEKEKTGIVYSCAGPRIDPEENTNCNYYKKLHHYQANVYPDNAQD